MLEHMFCRWKHGDHDLELFLVSLFLPFFQSPAFCCISLCKISASQMVLLTLEQPQTYGSSLEMFKNGFQSISKSHFKSNSLNHHLESHLHKNHFLYFFYFLTVLLNLMRTLESHSRLLYLASKKPEIDNGYIWMTIQRSCWRIVFPQNYYSQHLGRIYKVSWRCSQIGLIDFYTNFVDSRVVCCV